MITIKCNDLNVSKNLTRRIYTSVGSYEFVDKLITDYGVFPIDRYDSKFRRWLTSKLPVQILPIYHVLNGGISQKRILDLGCGSYHGTYEFKEFDPKTYEPWLCRALLELGANPIGVDIGNLDGERFEHYTLNLLLPNSLSFISDNSVDVAHADLLYDSPTLEQMQGCKNLRGLLVPQLERIVKPNGFFIEGM